MGKICLDDLEKYEEQSSREKFAKRKVSNPNKKHKKTTRKRTVLDSEEYVEND